MCVYVCECVCARTHTCISMISFYVYARISIHALSLHYFFSPISDLVLPSFPLSPLSLPLSPLPLSPLPLPPSLSPSPSLPPSSPSLLFIHFSIYLLKLWLQIMKHSVCVIYTRQHTDIQHIRARERTLYRIFHNLRFNFNAVSLITEQLSTS